MVLGKRNAKRKRIISTNLRTTPLSRMIAPRYLGGSGPRETPMAAIKYVGPMGNRQFREAADLHTFVFVINGTLTSSGTGTLATVFDGYAQATTSITWGLISPAFREYRILGMKVEYIPWNQYSKDASTITTTPLYVVADRTDATPLSSVSNAAGFASCQIKSLENRFTSQIRMDGIEESVWITVGSSPASAIRQYIKLYAAALTNATPYGDFITYPIVQFRGLL